jgi:dTDP-4-amino-4,6-dideoxygalactose transaminase
MFVGGEFYEDPRWLAHKPTISTENMLFLNGGKASLTLISEFLLDHDIYQILLPSYLCPTIITTLENYGLDFEYYQVNLDFSIDLEDLAQKSKSHRAVYFINYFGFYHSAATQAFLTNLKQHGVIVIEDNAQAGFNDQPLGDFAFNSIRKLAPYDGGYLVTSYDLKPYLEKYRGHPNRRLPVIRKYRKQLADYLFGTSDNRDELEAMYTLAESYYESDTVVAGDPDEQVKIERLDWKRIKKTRRDNYSYLMGLITGINGLSPIFPTLQENNMPLGLPVYVSGILRDWLLDELGNAGIGLTVHWDELLRDPHLNQNVVAVEMAQRILTLTIDQQTSHKQMDYMVKNLITFLDS